MAQKFVSVAGGGDGSSTSSRWTMAQANAGLVAGDTALIADGTYSTAINPANNGTAGNPITYEAEGTGANCTVTATIGTGGVGKSYITIKGINFTSPATNGDDWIITLGSSHHFHAENCTFTSNINSGTWTFNGIHLQGDYAVIRSCTFGPWVGGDMIRVDGDYWLIEDNDMSQADSGHGSIMVYGSFGRARLNYIRNKWSRIGENVSKGDDGTFADENVWEDNIAFDTGFSDPTDDGDHELAANEGYPLKGWALTDNDGTGGGPGGDAQMNKTGGRKSIYRRNLVVATNRRGLTLLAYEAVDQIGNFGTSYYFEDMRFYHNTYAFNQTHAVSMTRDVTKDAHYDRNRWINNLYYDNGNGHAVPKTFFLNDQALATVDLSTLHFINNLIADGFYRNATAYTAAQMNANTGGFFPNASGNISTAPTFVNSDSSTAEADRDIKILVTNFYLASGSAGKASGAPLATVTAGSGGAAVTTLTVSDSYCFSTGHGVEGVDPDELLINGQTTTFTGRTSQTQMTVSPAVIVNNGDGIYLAAYGTTPDIGITADVEEEEGEPPTLTVPVLVGTVDGGTATAPDFTSTSKTVSPNALLTLVVGHRTGGSVSPSPTVDSITTTIGGISAWTKHVEEIRQAATDTGIAFFTAQAGASPTPGTITAHATGGSPTGWKIALFEDTGHNTVTPVIEAVSDDGVATSMSLTMHVNALLLEDGSYMLMEDGSYILLEDAPDTANDIVIAAIQSRGDTDGVAGGAGYTELIDDATGTVHLQVMWQRGFITEVDWTGLAINANVGAAIKINEAAETFAQTINASHISSTAVVHQPTITSDITIHANHIPSTATVHQPALTTGAVTITANHVPSSAVVHQPIVSQDEILILPDHLPSTAVVHQPTISAGAITIAASHIPSTAQIHQASIVPENVNISPALVESTAVVHQPTVTVGPIVIVASYLPSTAVIHQPVHAAQVITASHLPSSAVVHQPLIYIYLPSTKRTYRVPRITT